LKSLKSNHPSLKPASQPRRDRLDWRQIDQEPFHHSTDKEAGTVSPSNIKGEQNLSPMIDRHNSDHQTRKLTPSLVFRPLTFPVSQLQRGIARIAYSVPTTITVSESQANHFSSRPGQS
jgi:hypothetical protein